MFLIIWSFRCATGRQAEFERAYGPAGYWGKLFAKSPEYLGTELVQRTTGADEYLTIDRWRSSAAYQQFRIQHATAYQALDTECERLTADEMHIGDFEVRHAAE